MIENKAPIVSVIVATYHRTESLYRALQSLAAQTYKRIEAVVVDDNAEEEWNNKVQHVIERIKSEYHDLCLEYIINETNLGSAKARNNGIRAARGEYITFLDDDDLYLPEKVEKQLEKMIQASADYSLTDLNLYNNNDKLVDRRIRSYITDTEPTALLGSHLKHHMTGTDTLMFKKDYLLRIGLFPPIDIGDEFFLMERAIIEGGRICYAPHCYVKAYIHEGIDEGLSSGEQKIRGENALYDLKKKYFPQLKRSDVRYIKVRHHMVIAFAQLRRRYWLSLIKHGIIAVAISPIDTIRILRGQR